MDLFVAMLQLGSVLSFHEVAEQCCPSDVECCYNRFVEQKPLRGCEKLAGNWRNATVCAEKLLDSDRSVQADLDTCCKYLMPTECEQDCLQSLQSPTLSGDMKMSFTERCERYNRTPAVETCVTVRQRLAHQCFSICLHKVKNYNPLTDCPELVANDDWCIGPEVSSEELPIAKRDLSKILGLQKVTGK